MYPDVTLYAAFRYLDHSLFSNHAHVMQWGKYANFSHIFEFGTWTYRDALDYNAGARRINPTCTVT